MVSTDSPHRGQGSSKNSSPSATLIKADNVVQDTHLPMKKLTIPTGINGCKIFMNILKNINCKRGENEETSNYNRTLRNRV
ncbi:hypothetical protein Shell_1148 [Staphylothermus hellenicus DSM 12710]|uniref:Uncharacterized protein n=1 Tax=Staphylothermus hellenicus (strain DSM 12710 / JCM 10830 / BK20S6-10-b1 / P8) TaxID=591019 RepID=D7D903_STAHD|nr:hypothetical protein Shell_1148 [Staphylothermus hellenicus DSM 12710]